MNSSREIPPQEKYQALVERNSAFEGLVYYGIKTTGGFCRPTCTARKPKFENCEYFDTPQQALLAGYRPCKRCQPLQLPGTLAEWTKRLLDAVERTPERRWKDADFRELGISSSTARREFKRRFGMTFVAYARARRLGLALSKLRRGEPGCVLTAKWFDTPLGPMLGIASTVALRLLEFTDGRGLEGALQTMRKRLGASIVPGDSPVLESLARDLADYFTGKKLDFRTPVDPIGSPFQQLVWAELRAIPPGATRSYREQASAIGRPAAVRAVARANGANNLAIIVPCHRVLGADGSLTGYGGGLHRKRWLLDHEHRSITGTAQLQTPCNRAVINRPTATGTIR